MDSAKLQVVIPMKPLAVCKSRLAEVLDPAQRATLSLWMLERVVFAARGCASVGDVVVLGGDAAIAAVAERLGARWEAEVADVGEQRLPGTSESVVQPCRGDSASRPAWTNGGGLRMGSRTGPAEGESPTRPYKAASAGRSRSAEFGLNRALDWARRESCQQGWPAMLFLAGDVPPLQVADVQALVDAWDGSRLVLAPGRRGGTNAVVVPRDLDFRFELGPDSFHHHLEQAGRLGAEYRVCHCPRLGADVDEPVDLAELTQAVPELSPVALRPNRPAAILRTSGMEAR